MDKRFSKIHLKRYKKLVRKYIVKCFIYDHKLDSYTSIVMRSLPTSLVSKCGKIINIYKTIKYIINI